MTDPLSAKQKKCIYAKVYRAAHRERLKQQRQARAAANPQPTRDKDAKYYAANRERILEKKHEDYLSRRESPKFKAKKAETGKAYRQKNPGYHKAYYAANREQLKQKQRERYLRYRELPEFKTKKAERGKVYSAENKTKLSEKRRAHHAKNRDRDNAQNRDWYGANREYRRSQIKKYAAEHSEDTKIRSDKWYRNNRARHYATCRAWVAAHPEAVRAFWQRRSALERNAPGSVSAGDLCRLYDQQKGCCHYCGVYMKNRFEVDHYIPLSRGGTHEPGNIVLACMPCNRSKGNKLPADFIRGRGRSQGKN